VRQRLLIHRAEWYLGQMTQAAFHLRIASIPAGTVLQPGWQRLR
jgi:hypothetical protein